MRIAKKYLALGIAAASLIIAREQAQAYSFGVLKSDLVVTSAGAMSPYVGYMVIKNQGAGPAAASTASMKLIGITGQVNRPVPSLGPGSSAVVYFTTTKPITKPGQATKFTADSTFKVTETNEANNVRYFTSSPG